ncbi:hypothetical protein MMC20_001465 [Loxospora ochrophaea]|nr:hypothetical protein [Loxospora ochrophaea]
MYPPRISAVRRPSALITFLYTSGPRRNPSHPRLFTQNSQLLLISRPAFRPELPFLHRASAIRPPSVHPRNSFPAQIARLITTEQKRYIIDQTWLAAKWTTYIWVGVALLATMGFGLNTMRLERRYPAPPEWSWVSRLNYWYAHWNEDPSSTSNGLVDWAVVGNCYMRLLLSLENPKEDGQSLHSQLGDEEDIYVEGIGKTGFDITSKSEPWRRGYHICLMGAARVAEHLDGCLVDTTRHIVFPPEVIIGPSNPRPKPVPFGAESPPLEENCKPAFEAPEKFYMKILTTHGFSTRQRLDAAIAYADWLSFKGLPSSAEEMYDWGLDIAMGALPVGVDNVVDTRTGIINDNATFITPNLLTATTALACHHAQNNNLSTALPIFLSILRSRRNLPTLPESPISSSPSSSSLPSSSLSQTIRSFIGAPPFPPPPSTEDLPAVRTPAAPCEEAGVMAHIGEILFASTSPSPTAPSSSLFRSGNSTTKASESHQAGLSWTREAVALAEETLSSIGAPSSTVTSMTAESKSEARDRCIECLEVGMRNWNRMVELLRQTEDSNRKKGEETKAEGWLLVGRRKMGEEVEEGRWAREAKLVEERGKKVRALIGEQRLTASGEAGAGGGSGFFIG